MDYNNYYNTPGQGGDYAVSESALNTVMRSVFLKMTLGLVVSALVAFFCANPMTVLTFMAEHSSLMFITLLLEVGLVIAISSGINKLSSPMATALFFLFAERLRSVPYFPGLYRCVDL